MIWLYGEESGEHDKSDGTLRRLTLGCGIAPCESWARLSVEWTDHLYRFERHGISWFHMTDFEARKEPYENLTDSERRDLLGGLLDIALRHVPLIFGTVDEPGHEPLWLRYGGNVLKTQQELTIAARTAGGKINVVLARIKGAKMGKLGHFIDQWADPDVFEMTGIGDPRTMPPLQVADIVAYEFSRAMRPEKPEKERYPLTRLKTAQHGCHLLSTKFLKRMEI